MKVLILNPILFTADNNVIPQVKSIKDTMIYNMCLGFKRLGHDVTSVSYTHLTLPTILLV